MSTPNSNPSPATPEPVNLPVATGCPNDTNGDGDCGRPLCPFCGKERRNLPVAPASQPPSTSQTFGGWWDEKGCILTVEGVVEVEYARLGWNARQPEIERLQASLLDVVEKSKAKHDEMISVMAEMQSFLDSKFGREAVDKGFPRLERLMNGSKSEACATPETAGKTDGDCPTAPAKEAQTASQVDTAGSFAAWLLTNPFKYLDVNTPPIKFARIAWQAAKSEAAPLAGEVEKVTIEVSEGLYQELKRLRTVIEAADGLQDMIFNVIGKLSSCSHGHAGDHEIYNPQFGGGEKESFHRVYEIYRTARAAYREATGKGDKK